MVLNRIIIEIRLELNMKRQLLENYAKVILTIGINLQKGQNLLIEGQPVHWYFINILAEEAYKSGAQFVKVNSNHPGLRKARVKFAADSSLSYTPTGFEAEIRTWVDERWAFISLNGMEDPHFFDNLNPERMAVIDKARLVSRLPFLQARLKGRCPWVICPVPTEKWAAEIMDLEPSSKALRKLWEMFISILSLDSDDPVAVWRDRSKTLKKRAQILNGSQYDYIRFNGPGTDIKTFLSPRSFWHGGIFRTEEGREYLPNLPTFEVFTTPDLRKTQGRAQITRPVKIFGSDVIGAWFEFKDGEVIEFGAEKGRDLLAKHFSVDERSKSLGEVALVDVTSPIYRTNKMFHSVLLDENAACHIALGRGLTMAIEGGDKLSEDELTAIGCNNSIQHLDFMIGSENISVFGGTKNGTEKPIIEKGHFVI